MAVGLVEASIELEQVGKIGEGIRARLFDGRRVDYGNRAVPENRAQAIELRSRRGTFRPYIEPNVPTASWLAVNRDGTAAFPRRPRGADESLNPPPDLN
ncbi:MAG TPA: hypothetical protein VFP91_18325, partial [Vicinamibacterales bacterium]|nr:hypothetical protein [Vicinamibacterales bacterium]